MWAQGAPVRPATAGLVLCMLKDHTTRPDNALCRRHPQAPVACPWAGGSNRCRAWTAADILRLPPLALVDGTAPGAAHAPVAVTGLLARGTPANLADMAAGRPGPLWPSRGTAVPGKKRPGASRMVVLPGPLAPASAAMPGSLAPGLAAALRLPARSSVILMAGGAISGHI